MARKPEIEYVRYYTDGTAARVIQRREPVPPVQAPPAPKKKRASRPAKRVDTIAVFGTLAAVVMLVLMLAGMIRLTATQHQIDQTAASVQALQSEHERLQAAYQDSYDPEAIRAAALSMGMIPREQAQHIEIAAEPAEEQRSWWDALVAQVRELFA